MKKTFNNVKPLNGIQMAHCITKVGFLCVNMFTNTGDKNVNLFYNKNEIYQADASPENVTNELLSELEKYYSMYYDDKLYPGHIISYDVQLNVCNMKFLHETHKGFKWPNHDDVQIVQVSLFYADLLN